MVHTVVALAWPVTVAAIVLALVAELAVKRLNCHPVPRALLRIACWLVAIALLLFAQLSLWFVRYESVLSVVQGEAQLAFWSILIATMMVVVHWREWSPRKRADAPRLRRSVWGILWTGVLAFFFAYVAVDEARTFWLDAFMPPIHITGRVEGVASQGTARKYHRYQPYITIGGRKILVTEDLYRSLKVGQDVALDVGPGSGWAIGVSR